MERTNMHTTAFDNIDIEMLTRVGGGDSGGFWQDMQNLGKAAVNGGVNTLNFVHDHPIELGKFGKFTIGGDRIEKPFKNDPRSQVGHRTVSGTPHPAGH
jgi:hypothetical protein